MKQYKPGTKQYKPGQFVSIGGKLARVTLRVHALPLTVCDECKVRNKSLACICTGKDFGKCNDMPHNCYPKLIKQCGNRGK